MGHAAALPHIPYGAQAHVPDHIGVDDPLEVQATSVAAVLNAASSSRARTFAVPAHESMCIEGNDEQADFWSLILTCLAPPRC